jgi:DNA modification methylase
MEDSRTVVRDWPADIVERWPLERIKEYPRNARIHTDQQVAQIAESIDKFGVTAPVLVDEDGVLIFGHGRRRAAELLGFTELPVSVAHGWTEEEKKAYRIADNQLGLNASWDLQLLKLEISDLKMSGFDMPLLGFDNTQLVQFTAGLGGNADPEAAPEPPKEPVSRRGDLWLLGEHRLLCGDATSKQDAERLLNGATPHLMVTDPPYGVDYDPNWRNEANKWSGSNVKLGAAALGKVRNDQFSDWTAAWQLYDGDVAYVWHAALMVAPVEASLIAAELTPRSQIIWNKTRGVIGRGNYHWQHEPCWYAVRKGKKSNWQGSRQETTVWDIAKSQTSETGHGTQKPIECMKRPIENNSKGEDWVYDPFVGSGTTIIACEMTARKALGMDIDPAYVDVAVERWQTFTGLEAALETGETMTQVRAERAAGASKGKGATPMAPTKKKRLAKA